MSIATDILKAAVDLGTSGTGKMVKFVVGNPVASRVAAGSMIGQGISDALKEATATAGNKRGIPAYIKAGMKVAIGGVLAVFNDPKWYENTGAQKYSTSLQYNYRRSMRPSYGDQPDVHCVVFHVNQVVPYDPSLSMDKDILAMYKTIMAANNRIGIYDVNTLRAYITNVRVIVAEYTRLVRFYGLLNTINSMDSTIPKSILAGLGLNDNALATAMNNMASIRMIIMQLARDISANYPMLGDYINRTTWMYSNIYLDDDNTKAIPMLFDAAKYTFAKYNVNTGKFQYQTMLSTPLTQMTQGSQLLSAFNAIKGLMDNIPGVDILAADILKAYGIKAYPCLDVPAEDYSPAFVYNEEVLTIIENTCAAHYGYVDQDTGFSSIFNPSLLNTGVQPIFKILTPTEIIRTLNGNPSVSMNLTGAYGVTAQADTAHPENKEIVNSPMTETPISMQIAMTRMNNCIEMDLHYDGSNGTSLGNNAYSLNHEFSVNVDTDTITQSNSGDDIFALTIVQTNVPRPSAITIAAMTVSKYHLFQHYVIRLNQDTAPLDDAGQTVYFFGDAQSEIIRTWGTVDWMPRLGFLNVQNDVTANTNGVNSKAYYYELFDEKVYAPYPQSAKEVFDTIANDSLYFVDVLLREVSTDNVTDKIVNKSSGNKAGKKGSKKSKKNNKKGKQPSKKDMDNNKPVDHE